MLDLLEIRTFMAIGASSGAMTLLHMATQRPARVEAMVLVGGTTYYPEQTRVLLRDPKCEEMTPEEWTEMRGKHRHGDQQIWALTTQFCNFKDSYDDMTFTPDRLSIITARTLIVHGDRDRFFPVAIPTGMYNAIPHSYLWIVPNGGHLPIFEGPRPCDLH